MKASCSLTALLDAVDDILGPEPACDHRDKNGERHLPWSDFATLTLSTGKGKLTVMGTYKGLTAEIVIVAKVRASGAVDLRASALQHLLQALLTGEGASTVELLLHGDRLHLTAGPSTSSIPATTRLNAEVEAIDASSHVVLPASDVYSSIRMCIFAVGTDTKLGTPFRALHFSQTGRVLTTIATDGKVLVRSQTEGFGPVDADNLNSFPLLSLPLESAETLSRMLRSHTDKTVDLRIAPTYCSWTLPNGTRLTSALVTAAPVDFLAVIPARDNFRPIQVESLRSAFEMLAVVGTPSALLQFDDNELKVTGSYVPETPIATTLQLHTGPFPRWRGRFGTLYLCHILEHVDGSEQAVEISMGEELRDPLVVRDAAMLVVLMPQASTHADYRS